MIEYLNQELNYRSTDNAASKRAGIRAERSGKAERNRQALIDAVAQWPGGASRDYGKIYPEIDRYEAGRRLPECAATERVRRTIGADGEWHYYPIGRSREDRMRRIEAEFGGRIQTEMLF